MLIEVVNLLVHDGPRERGRSFANGPDVLPPANSDSAAVQMSLSNPLYSVPAQSARQAFPNLTGLAHYREDSKATFARPLSQSWRGEAHH
jgi:hypothetical protein